MGGRLLAGLVSEATLATRHARARAIGATALVATLALLAGCVNVGKAPPAARSVFDFGPPAAAQPGGLQGVSLGLDLQAPAWVDQNAQVYRLGYDSPQQLREYAQSRWAGSPSQLVAQRLRQRLALPTAGGRCGLQGHMEEFAQVFDSATQSRGVMRLTWRLMDRQGATLAVTLVAVEAAAASADARGGAVALAEATDRVALATADWLRALDAAGILKGCAG